MMKQPVIKYEFFSRRTRIFFYVVSSLVNLILGFIIGVILANPTNEIIIEVPEMPWSSDRSSSMSAPIRGNRWEYSSLSKEAKCLADNIYHEGRGQDKRGQIAIGLVTINRVKSARYPDSICGVVWEKRKDRRSGKMTPMFSWTLDGESDAIKSPKVYKKIKRLAGAMIAEGTLDNFKDFTEGATHYHNTSVKPYWAPHMERIAKIDQHIFYKP